MTKAPSGGHAAITKEAVGHCYQRDRFWQAWQRPTLPGLET
jgi:hypothetical protein